MTFDWNSLAASLNKAVKAIKRIRESSLQLWFGEGRSRPGFEEAKVPTYLLLELRTIVQGGS